MIDFTPELRREAIEIARRYVLGPIFTPPSLKSEGGTQGTLQLPGEIGGAQYTGSAFDRSTGLLYVPSITSTFAADLIPGDEQSGLRYVRGTRQTIVGPQGLPLMKPPYGRITAIDLNTGEHAWMTPNAEGPREHPAIKQLKLGPLGQPTHSRVIATPTLLLAVQGDVTGEAAAPPFGGPNGRRFQAYDKKTGAVVFEMELPAGATGGMVTYLYNGKQYIVFPIGTAGETPEILALSLP